MQIFPIFWQKYAKLYAFFDTLYFQNEIRYPVGTRRRGDVAATSKSGRYVVDVISTSLRRRGDVEDWS